MSESKSLRQLTPDIPVQYIRQPSADLPPLPDDSSKITLQGPVGPEGGKIFRQEIQDRIMRGETTSGMWYLSEYQEKAHRPTWHDRQEELILLANFIFIRQYTFSKIIQNIQRLVPPSIRGLVWEDVLRAMWTLSSATKEIIKDNYTIFNSIWNKIYESPPPKLIDLIKFELPADDLSSGNMDIIDWDNYLHEINREEGQKNRYKLDLLKWSNNPPSNEEIKEVIQQYVLRSRRGENLKIINKKWLQLVDRLENDFIKKNRVRLAASSTASAVTEGAKSMAKKAKCIGQNCAAAANTTARRVSKLFSRKKRGNAIGGKKKKTRRKKYRRKRKKTRRKRRKTRKKN